MHKIGKIKEFDSYIGKIVSEDQKIYYFLYYNLLDDTLQKDDLVIFNAKEGIFLQAYCIRRFTKTIEQSINNKQVKST